MNVKLQHVISDITGKAGMDIIESIVGGQRNPRKLAQLRGPMTRADERTIALSLRAGEKLSYSIAGLCPYPARAEATNW